MGPRNPQENNFEKEYVIATLEIITFGLIRDVTKLSRFWHVFYGSVMQVWCPQSEVMISCMPRLNRRNCQTSYARNVRYESQNFQTF